MREYSIMELAMYENKCEEQDTLRTIQAYILNFAGMGTNKIRTPQEILPIPLIDNKFIIRPIKSIQDALSLLKEFEN